MPVIGFHSGVLPPLPPDPTVTAWVAAVIANGGTVSSGRQTLVQNLVVGLKADGVFAKLDRLWLFAAENQPSALTDIVADSLATVVASPTFTTDRGFTGDGATSYIDSNFNLATQGVNYTLNAASVGMWLVTGPGIGQVQLGAATSSFSSEIKIVADGTNVGIQVNDAGGFIGNSTTTGLISCSRSDASNKVIYLNAAANALSQASVSIPSTNIYILARDRITVGAEAFFSGQAAGAFFGGTLTGTDMTNLYGRLRTYMTAVGVP